MSPRSALARAALIGALLAAVACAWVPAVQQAADAQVDAGLKRALVAFAAAKTLNAAISVAQGTQVALQPAGVGVGLALGEVLDPINDLVEQFASLMLAASVAFGVQKVLLAVGAHWAISLVLSAAALAWALLHWRGGAPPWLTRALAVLLVLRFAIPVATIGSDWVFRHFLADDQRQAQAALNTLSAKIDAVADRSAAPAPEPGLLERLKRWSESSGTDLRKRLEELRQAADQASDHIVRLIVVFVLQTMVVPLLLLWAQLKLAARVFEPPPGVAAG